MASLLENNPFLALKARSTENDSADKPDITQPDKNPFLKLKGPNAQNSLLKPDNTVPAAPAVTAQIKPQALLVPPQEQKPDSFKFTGQPEKPSFLGRMGDALEKGVKAVDLLNPSIKSFISPSPSTIPIQAVGAGLGELIERPAAGLRALSTAEGKAENLLPKFVEGVKNPQKYPKGTFAESYVNAGVDPGVAGALGSLADVGIYFGIPDAMGRIVTGGKVSLLNKTLENINEAYTKAGKAPFEVPEAEIQKAAQDHDVAKVVDFYFKSKNLEVPMDLSRQMSPQDIPSYSAHDAGDSIVPILDEISAQETGQPPAPKLLPAPQAGVESTVLNPEALPKPPQKPFLVGPKMRTNKRPISNIQTLTGYIKMKYGGINPASIKDYNVNEDFKQSGLTGVLNKKGGNFSTIAANMAANGLLENYKEGDSENEALMNALKIKQPYGGKVNEPTKTLDQYEAAQANKLQSEYDRIIQELAAEGYSPEQIRNAVKSGETSAQNEVDQEIRDSVVPEELSSEATSFNPDEMFQEKDLTPTFHSQLEKTIEQKMPNASSPEQIMGILNNSGVKKEEMDWLGIDQFLEGKQKVSKSDLLNYIRQNDVRVEEVLKPEPADYRVFYEGQGFDPKVFKTLEEAESYAKEKGGRISAPVKSQTKFESYQLPGGENYKELLLTLPSNKKPNLQWKENRQGLWAWFSGDKQVSGAFVQNTETQKKIAMDTINNKTVDNLSGNYRTPHFDEPNVLAHIRFNDRTDSEGKKVLFLEEIQSDWHQKGRKEGYKGVDKDFIPKEQLDALRAGAKEALNRNDILGFDSVGQALEEIARHDDWETRWEVPTQEDRDLINKWREAQLKNYKYTKGVPNAPFKKTWHELAMKRMLRYAAENGYDKIAWTTGEQQAERYDLSKQIEKITHSKNGDGTYNLHIVDKIGRDVYDKLNVPEKDVEDLVGKEVAKKIIEREGEPKKGPGSDRSFFTKRGKAVGTVQKNGSWYIKWEDGSESGTYVSKSDAQKEGEQITRDYVTAPETSAPRVLTGLDLKVGGEGMKGFYDQIIPSFLNKYTKKWGGKVGVSEIEIKPGEHDVAVVRNEDGTFQVLDKLDPMGPPLLDHASAAEKNKFLKESVNLEKVHSLEITPELKASVLNQGQPLFQEKGKAEVSTFAEEEKKLRGLIQKHGIENVVIKLVDAIPTPSGKGAYGSTVPSEGLVKFIGRPLTTTGYHEAFHLLIRKAGFMDQAKELFNEVQSQLGAKSPLDAEEMLADGFAEYANGRSNEKWPDRIRRFFKDLWQAILKLFKREDIAKSLFKDLYEGKQANFKGRPSQSPIPQPEGALFQQKPSGGGEEQSYFTGFPKPTEKIPGYLKKRFTPAQSVMLLKMAKDKGLIRTLDNGKTKDKFEGLVRHYDGSTFQDFKNYLSALNGQPSNPPFIFKIYGDIHQDAEAMKLIEKESESWQDINEFEMSTLDPVRIIEKVTGKDLTDSNILADNTFLTLAGADDAMFIRLEKELKELDVNRLGIQKGSTEDKQLMYKAEKGLYLDGRERKVVGYLREKLNGLINEANERRMIMGRKPIPYRQNYFPHIIQSNLLNDFFKDAVDPMKDVTNEQLEAIRKGDYTKGNMPFNRFAQRRMGEYTKYAAIGNYEIYLKTLLKEIYYSPAIAHARKFIDYSLKRQVNAYKALDRLINDLKGKPSEADKTPFGVIAGSKPIQILRSQIARNALIFNINFMAMNASNFALSYGELGNYLNEGLIKFNFDKKFKEFAFKKSSMLRSRLSDPDLDPSVIDFKNPASALSGIYKAVGRFGNHINFLNNLLEFNNVGSTWAGAYIKATRELGYGQGRAVQYADAIARRTQVGYKKYEQNAWMRSNSGKLLSQFQNWSFNAMNHLLYDMKLANIPHNFKAKITGKDSKPVRWSAFMVLLGVALTIDILYRSVKTPLTPKGLRAPYGPPIPFIAGISGDRQAPVFALGKEFGRIAFSKKPETKIKAGVRIATSVLPPFGGSQINRFLNGQLVAAPEKDTGAQAPAVAHRFTGKPFSSGFKSKFKSKF